MGNQVKSALGTSQSEVSDMASERGDIKEESSAGQDESKAIATKGEEVDPELLVKHPLQNRWALWFFKNDKSRKWEDNLRCVTSVDTVEDFWALYNHILPVSKLPSGCDYSMFKEGIEPMWEDKQNRQGGRWLVNLDRRQREVLDCYWQETLLCLIGEAFDEQSDDVCGAVVNIRGKGDKLAMWTTDSTRIDANRKIGKKFKERLNIPPKMLIGYQSHADTSSKTGSTAKNKITV